MYIYINDIYILYVDIKRIEKGNLIIQMIYKKKNDYMIQAVEKIIQTIMIYL